MVRCGCFDPNDPPTEREPAMMACPSCDARDSQCPTCGGVGRLRVTEDPHNTVPLRYFKIAQYAEMYIDNGLPPVAGGTLDQSNWFVSAATFCSNDKDRNLAEQYGKT